MSHVLVEAVRRGPNSDGMGGLFSHQDLEDKEAALGDGHKVVIIPNIKLLAKQSKLQKFEERWFALIIGHTKRHILVDFG